MELWRDGLIAFLAAVGVATIFWLIAEQIFRLRLTLTSGAAVILAVRGREERLERKIRRLQEAVWGMKAAPPIVVVDCGLDEASARAAAKLAARDMTFTLCSQDGLRSILEELTKQETKHS